ncbi:Hsp20/alpha crystallin family protein [ANME-1 cluster archaeon AG-394-G21]|nr:Hsp20/alpha crystallin family protein [ANME-1 cluster archaeon AG-394-G21]VUT26286.1 MAG: Small heat shock protein HSP16.5 [Candidatus Methanolliviera sp. GoM_asphalt]
MVWRRKNIWDPFEELRRMEELVDRAFGETGPDYFGRRALPGAAGEELAETAAPYVDIKEKEGKIIVAADIPGVEKSDISINIRGDTLEISAEKKEEKEEEEEGYIRRERSYKKFYRSIPLPTEVDKDNVDATFENGVLQIEMPKLAIEEVKKIELK